MISLPELLLEGTITLLKNDTLFFNACLVAASFIYTLLLR